MHDWHTKTGRAFITSGIGYGRTKLSAFDAAELNANIISTNAVKVTSFIPPNWQIVANKDELGQFTKQGVFLPMAYSFAASNKDKVAASVLIGVNKNLSKASIITEHADVNISEEYSLEQAEMCLEDTFNSRCWNIEKRYKISVQAAPKKHLYVCAMVAVVFVVNQLSTGEK
jgi:pyruvoyl-dependent arginine decarboxylase